MSEISLNTLRDIEPASAAATMSPKRSHRASSRLTYLLRLLSNSDFYDKLNGPFADPLKLDGTLSTICYGALFLSEVIKRKPQIASFARKLYIRLLTQLLRLIPKNYDAIVERQIATFKQEKQISEKKPSENTKLMQTADKLRSLSDYLSDIRIFNRMWGMPSLMAGGISDIKTTLSTPGKSRAMKLVEIIDTVSIVAFQPLENIGFVADHAWTFHKDHSSSAAWYYVISCRFWAAFVVLELVKIAKSIVDTKKAGQNLNLLANSALTRSIVANLANLPLTVHWSLFDGCLSDLSVGFFGTWSTLLDTLNDWNEVRKQVENISV